MHLVRAIATAAIIATSPAAMAANAPDQPAALHLVRAGGGGFHGGMGGGFHGGGFHGRYARHGGWHPRGYGYDYLLPYPYVCQYPYSYPYCTFSPG